MSTIKSSNEHLTFNADGSAKEIRFQANGTQKASISSAGLFTSTTIDATALTGNLPAISGASLTNLPATDISGKLNLSGGTMTGNIAHGGAFTIDAVGDISLDSEGAILIKNGGSAIGRISNSGSDMIIKSDTSDKDILFKGSDGGSTITALTLDMSNGGTATFNNGVNVTGNLNAPNLFTGSSGATLAIYGGATNQGGKIVLSGGNNTGADGSGIKFYAEQSTGTPAERMCILKDGNVGINVSDPDSSLEIKGRGGSSLLSLKTTDSSGNTGFWAKDGGAVGVHYWPFMINQDHDDTACPSSSYMYVHHASNPFVIKSDGKVGIGTTSPGNALHVYQASGTPARFNNIEIGLGGDRINCTDGVHINHDTNANVAMVSGSSTGKVEVGGTSPQSDFSVHTGGAHVTNGTNSHITGLQVRQNAYSGYLSGMSAGDSAATTYNCGFIGFLGGSHSGAGTRHIIFMTRPGTTDAHPTERMRITDSGSVTIAGSLSKGSGSFKIDHPLPAKKDTHHLVHSFVESPRADLIYRDKVTLVNGSAIVNIDTVAGMTEGTFVLLCDDVQCFTSNESNWDAVKGSVSGNTLTIECENSSSTANVSWMVVADRKDEHIMGTTWTDENGKPIIEPEKVIEKDGLDRGDFETDEEYQEFLQVTGG